MNMHPTLTTSTGELFTASSSTRRACMLVLALSQQKKGAPVGRMRDCIHQLINRLRADPAIADSLELGIISAAGQVNVLRDITPLRELSLPVPLSSTGDAPLGKAVVRALQTLEAREADYRQAGLRVLPACLVILGRGGTDDAWPEIALSCRALEREGKLRVISAALGADTVLPVLAAFGAVAPISLAQLGMSHLVETLRRRIGDDARPPLPQLDPGQVQPPLPVPALPVPLRALETERRPVIALQIRNERPLPPAIGMGERVLSPRQALLLQHGWTAMRARLGLRRRVPLSQRHSAAVTAVAEAKLPSALPAEQLWLGAADTCVGAAHLRQESPTPCQDAALVVTGPCPMLVVADGAGSSPLSDVGADTVVVGLRRLAETLSRHFRMLLDTSEPPSEANARALAHTLVRHACGLLEDLARLHRRPATDFRSTLLVALGGRSHWLWARVGDGALVIERNGVLQLLGAAGKGEFANQTVFLGETLRPEQVQWGLEASAGLSGVAAMTDGAAERLVSTDGTRISGQLGCFFREAREDRLRRGSLRAFFQEREVWRSSSGDDRGLAILACQAAAS